ncbi:MAG: AraC family transcriptional regulator ligand-binding domain-containing protein [Caldilineaceae bacterium]|nr:AraC family transcriptional regulator ligand-binding domain-containing protein [Caldilineaceae bacterium]
MTVASAHPQDRIRLSHAVLARIKDSGFSLAELLHRARLPATLLQQESMVVTTAQWFALWAALDSYVDDPAFGLKLPRLMRGAPYDALMITALSAPSFHAALHKIARYKRLFSAEDLQVASHRSEWHIEVIWLATAQLPPPRLIDASFAHIVEVGQQGTGQLFYPTHVMLRRDEAHRSLYEDYFHCPVDFSASCDRLVFSHAVIMQPFVTANPDLLALIEPQLETERRNRIIPPHVIDQVKWLIRNRIAGGLPTVQEIASELMMSTRTLQRRLAEEGLSFYQLLETVRHELAKEYLQASSLALTEIAFLLGYKEASSFHRAFQQWEGLSPGQWRGAKASSL